MIKGLSDSLKMVNSFMQNHERRAKTVKEKLKEADEKLKKKDGKLRKANEQIVLLRNNLDKVEAELQSQHIQFFE